MPDLLIELFSEEIPARMQARAADDLSRLVSEALSAAGLRHAGAKAFATPRRLALHVSGIPAQSPDLSEERKGPRVDAPEKAIQGFVKSAGFASIAEAEIRSDPKKGDFYIATIRKPGRVAEEVIAEAMPGVIRGFPWPKSMRWGAASAQPGALRWVRPLHSIVCTFGPETENPEIVPFEVDGVRSGDETRGHRFMAPQPFSVKRLDDYAAKLEAAKVVLDPERRRRMIRQDALALATAQGLDLVEDDALLHETAGLVEWPVVLMGRFDEAFLELPPEVIRTTIRANQKCFVLRDAETGKLANRFILVANLEAKDGGQTIIAGNERVVRARLSDARFFYEQDLKAPLESRLPRLETIVFHEKLGSQAERVARIERLARTLAPLVGADADVTARAARLAKADLVTEMVGEFPELQGLMGRYYATAQGEDPAIALAIEGHYKPQGPGDTVPDEAVSVAVALADKLDTLEGFWRIDETPTGSKDPYSLRRAALGVIRLVLANDLRVPLRTALGEADEKVQTGLLDFFADRLKVQLREQGARHDLVDAVFSLGGQDDLVLIVRRVEALGRLLESDDGRNLLVGVKRAQNILRIEEKRDGRAYDGAPDRALFGAEEERALSAAIDRVRPEAAAAIIREDYEGAMRVLAQLRAPVDAFFDRVTVNTEEPHLRENRLRLLNEIREATLSVADFSRIEG